MEETKDRKPVLTIECPDGMKIKIFQQLSEEYMRELVEVFTERGGVVVSEEQ